MQTIDLDDAKHGMVIEENVVNARGATLVKKGVSLTGDLIAKLKSWGITTLSVAGTGDPGPDETFAAAQVNAEELRELERRFANVRGNAIMDVIKTAASEYLAEKGKNNG